VLAFLAFLALLVFLAFLAFGPFGPFLIKSISLNNKLTKALLCDIRADFGHELDKTVRNFAKKSFCFKELL
jgi:hypothetical protein